jgi:hypothetical protein
MRTIYLYMSAALFILSSCTTVIINPRPSGKVPPGQMKKATGSKSAKPYAPGQQKKK